MAYDKKELTKLALKVIDKYKLFFIEDIVSYLPCSRATFYNHDLDKLDEIKEALLEVRTQIKVGMRSKWYKSENATLQISLMKLISSDEERKRLSQQFHELSGNVSHEKKLDTSKLKTETLADLFENGVLDETENLDNE